jgi:host factor-I protein
MSNQASVQDKFLHALITEKTLASVYLINGIRLSGQVASFDSYVVVVESVSGLQMIFKHAISTVLPNAGGAGATVASQCGRQSGENLACVVHEPCVQLHRFVECFAAGVSSLSLVTEARFRPCRQA